MKKAEEMAALVYTCVRVVLHTIFIPIEKE
jgi:hypothetical protein